MRIYKQELNNKEVEIKLNHGVYEGTRDKFPFINTSVVIDGEIHLGKANTLPKEIQEYYNKCIIDYREKVGL